MQISGEKSGECRIRVVSGSNIYVGDNSGLAISTNGGTSFTFSGYGSVYDLTISNGVIYIANTSAGLRVSGL